MDGVAQFVTFCGVGGINTVVDLAAFNLLAGNPLKLGRIAANFGSTSAAMATSYAINSTLVFEGNGASLSVNLGRFVVVTLISAYVIQSLIIYLLSYRWVRPAEWGSKMIQGIAWGSRVSTDMVQRNFVKAVAVGVGISWNFFWYKYYVFGG